jgi:hypothetical protein
MTQIDLITMIGNLSRSIFSVQRLLTGFAYVLGLLFIIKAIKEFKKFGERSGQHKIGVPIVYLLMGSFLLFLPSVNDLLANTVFGAGNILQYAQYKSFDIQSSMGLIIRTAGIIWFIRGCVLLTHAGEGGAKEGPKGMLFLCAGILAMNFDNSIYYLDWAMGHIASYTLTSPKS